MLKYAPYSICTFLCISGGICGKLVRPPNRQLTVEPQVRHPEGHVCAVNVCKPASSTSSTGRVTDQPYPAGDTGGQRNITLLMNSSYAYIMEKIALDTGRQTDSLIEGNWIPWGGTTLIQTCLYIYGVHDAETKNISDLLIRENRYGQIPTRWWQITMMTRNTRYMATLTVQVITHGHNYY